MNWVWIFLFFHWQDVTFSFLKMLLFILVWGLPVWTCSLQTAGRLSPILIKMVFWGGGELPPLRKLKNNPWWLLNILVHDVINLLYDEHLTDKQKYFYVWNLLLQKLIHQLWLVIKDNLHLGISILSNT